MKSTTFSGLLAGGLMIIISLLPTTGMTVDLNNKIYVPGDKGSSNFLKTPKLSWEEIVEHYTPAEGIEDWQKLVSKRHWKKGYSAYETAASWYNANPDLPQEIQALFGDSAELLIATPEHATPLPGGKTSSKSDVLAFIRMEDNVCALAVEGKMDESFGPTVGEWLKNASAGKIERLKYISKKLGLRYPPADKIRYQLLHRTAAAVIEAERFNADCAAVVIHSFAPNQEAFRDYGVFLGLFGVRSIQMQKLYDSDKAGISLSFGWASPKQSIVASDATAVTKTTTLPFKAQSITVAIGLIAILALVIFVVVFVRQTSLSKNKIVQDGEITVAENVDVDKEKSDDEQGKTFESYVENLLANRENVKLLKPSNKYDYPDFEMEILSENQRIFLECKWRNSFYKGRYNVIKGREKLQKYKEYQKAHGHPFFIVLGVGGTEEKPDYLYAIPLEKLPETKLNYEQLMSYIQKATGYCSYNSATNTLTIR